MTQSFSRFAQFGAVMPKSGIQKFSAKKGDTRIRILSVAEGDFLLAKTHYLKGVGSFHCFGGSCCTVCANAPEGESNTQERAILPIAVATPSVAGGISVEYFYLALPETKYSQLLSLHQNVGDVTQYDILIQCTDEQYQKYTFLPLINQPSAILGTQEQVNKAGAFLNTYRGTIMNQLGKTLNEATFNAARAKSLQNAASSVGVQFTPNAQASQVFAQPQVMPALPQQIQTVTPQPVEVKVVSEAQPVPPVVNAVPQAEEIQPVPEATVTPIKPMETEPSTTVESTTTDIDWSQFMAN